MRITESELVNRIIKLYNDKMYKQGYELIIENEDIIEKKYYEITEYKIRFLVALNKLIEASIIVKEELSLPYIPKDFESFLIQINKEINFTLNDKNTFSISEDDLENLDKLDNSTLLAILPLLKKYNLNEYVRQLQNIFLNTNIKDIVKTLLIACLSDSKLNADFYVIKNEVTVKFNPTTIFDIREGDNFIYIENKIKELTDLQINIQQILVKLTTTYLLNVYPLIISNHECDILLCASLLLSFSMMNLELKNDYFKEIYSKHSKEVQKMCEKLNILLETI